MSETKNGKLGLYGAEHSKCNGMMTLGFKGLNQSKPDLRAVDQMEYVVSIFRTKTSLLRNGGQSCEP